MKAIITAGLIVGAWLLGAPWWIVAEAALVTALVLVHFKSPA